MKKAILEQKRPMTKKSILPHFDGEIYNKYLASTYDFLTTLSGWRSKLARHALDGLSPCRLLDVGCGTGFLLSLARQRGFDAVGVDPSEGMLNLAIKENNIARNHLFCATSKKLPFPDAGFDLVVASGSLIYEPSMTEAARELARVIKSGGRLRVIDHTTPKQWNLLTPVIYVFMHMSGGLIHDFESYFSPYFELVSHTTLGRGGYLQRFDFIRR